MNKPPPFSTDQNNSNFRSLSRILATVSALGICVGLTAPVFIASCNTGVRPSEEDAASSDAGGLDAARFDAAGLDAAVIDAAVPDAAVLDAAVADAAVADAAVPDAAVPDAAVLDAAVADAAVADAAVPDAAVMDAARPDLAVDLSRSDSGSVGMDAGPDLSVPSTDPFDPASCSGPAVSSAQALAMLGTSPRVKLADSTLYYRRRTCTTTPPTCGAWSTPVVHTQALLTYSGGTVTDYKTFTFPTHLIVYLQSGQAKFVIRHESDYRKYPTNDMRGVGFSIGADPMENTYPVIYVWDFAPAPSRYEDLQGRLLTKGQLHVAERCARVVFATGMTEEIAALYKF